MHFTVVSLDGLPKINIFERTTITSNHKQMIALSERLSKAEAQLGFLTKEIADIKCKMQQLQKVSAGARLYSTTSSNFTEPNCDPPAKKLKTEGTKLEYENDHVVVYTDGACENNGYKGAKAGIGVWFGDDHPFNVSAPVEGKPTNNAGEIQACIRAVRIALDNDIKKLCIKTDSNFVINAMTSWIKKWKKNNWKLSTGGDVKNKVDFEKLDNVCKQMDSIKWVHVNGHCGIEGNEKADILARRGAAQYKA
ncbi:putative endonuclease that specifically degrades the RNA of RNA- DNA hybrids [Trypoxylus dichotomus]